MLEFVPVRLWSIPQLMNFLEQFEPYEGLTFVGGEPVSQAATLVHLIDGLRARRDTGFVTYTEYMLGELLAAHNAAWHALVERTDLLVDGEYVVSHAGRYL